MKIGDKVEIIKYGHILFTEDDLPFKKISGLRYKFTYDLLPQVVGKTGVIDAIDFYYIRPNEILYSVLGIPEKHFWYNESQLKKLF
jgi:hypothetical protein